MRYIVIPILIILYLIWTILSVQNICSSIRYAIREPEVMDWYFYTYTITKWWIFSHSTLGVCWFIYLCIYYW